MCLVNAEILWGNIRVYVARYHTLIKLFFGHNFSFRRRKDKNILQVAEDNKMSMNDSGKQQCHIILALSFVMHSLFV
jgi:hypothetical protein